MVNIDALKLHFEGDEELISELIEIFEDSYPKVLSDLKAADAEKDYANIELHAHTLKGMIANFFADDLKTMAANLEQRGRDKTPEDNSELLSQLSDLLPKLVIELKGIA